jgi:hypothetical protein
MSELFIQNPSIEDFEHKGLSESARIEDARTLPIELARDIDSVSSVTFSASRSTSLDASL